MTLQHPEPSDKETIMIKPQILGLIPARGGSKGVPRKNIRSLCGKPLIAHTIEAALRANSLSRIIVSTDDPEIAEVARRAGAEVPFLRPACFATDTASSLSVLKHAIDWLRTEENWCPEALAVLAPTSPLRSSEHIDGTIDLFFASGTDSAVTITSVQDHPYFVYSRTGDGQMHELLPIPDKPMRRQELPSFFTHTQAVVISRCSYLNRCQDPDPSINFQSLVGYEVNRDVALDIDTPDDFVRAEMLLEKRLVEGRNAA